MTKKGPVFGPQNVRKSRRAKMGLPSSTAVGRAQTCPSTCFVLRIIWGGYLSFVCLRSTFSVLPTCIVTVEHTFFAPHLFKDSWGTQCSSFTCDLVGFIHKAHWGTQCSLCCSCYRLFRPGCPSGLPLCSHCTQGYSGL